VSNALWMFFIDKRKVISKVFIFAFQPRWKSGVRLSETLRRRMTSDAPRRRRNRRRRADERARCERDGISSVARRDRSRDRSRVDSRRRTTRPVAKDPPDDGGLSSTEVYRRRRVVILLPPLPTARNENEDETKRILPFPRTKPPLRRSRAHPLPSTFETRKPEALN